MSGGPNRSRRAAALLAAAAALLAGCAGGADPPPASGRGDPHGLGGATGPSVAVVPRAELTAGGTVTWGVDELPESLNTYHQAAGPVTAQVAGAVLPSLFTLDQRGEPRPNADVLVSAEVTEREPRQTVVYTLHPDAAWSDGRPLGVADFRAQWQALNGTDRDYPAARAAGYDRIASVAEGPGEHQVTVTFAQPHADWRALFSPLYPSSVTGDADLFNEGPARDAEPPASGGPFAVAEVDRAAGTITLVRNDAWWGRPALLDELVFAAVSSGERRDALLAGELDLAEVAPAEAKGVPPAGGWGRIDAAGYLQAAQDDRAGAAAPPPAGAAPADAGAAMHALATAALAAATSETSDARAEAARAHDRYLGALSAAERARGDAFAARERDLADRLNDLTVYRAYDPGYTQLTLNAAAPALGDERVRWALAGAIDRAALAAAVHEPAGLPVQPLGSHLRTADQARYWDTSDAPPAPGWGDADGSGDPAAAEALLDEAGWRLDESAAAWSVPGGWDDVDDGVRLPAGVGTPWRPTPAETPAETSTTGSAGVVAAGFGSGSDAGSDAGGVRSRDGKPLELRLVLPDGPGAAALRGTGRRIAAMLAEVGVRAELTEVPADEFFAETLPGGAFDLALYSWPATAFPATDAPSLFAKPRTLPGGQLTFGQNYSRVGTDYVDQLLRQAAGELDATAQDELLRRADAQLWTVAGSLPLYQPPQLVAARNDLAGVGAHGLATPRYQDIGFRR
ncbi:ABC transporter family substrate-binding protein [Streptomyces sp. B6B3]|uniref:ABC transporter family substrate-binding protein n=1 Tax=Streptomyces sp. B6B3 TaxID=3153570 RepID=UPI00325E2DCA